MAMLIPLFHCLISHLLFCTSFATAIRIPHTNTNNHGTHNHNTIVKRSVTLDLPRNPDYAPNGPAAYARALKKWGAKVPKELTKSLAAMRGDVGKGDVNADTVINDREYLSRVGFGTPLQWLNVDLDTGSSDVWVYSNDTFPEVAGNRTIFRIQDSSTAQRIANTTWMITYGDGSRAWGNVYNDTLSLATIPFSAPLESCISASPSLTTDPFIDGIFGLAYNLPSQTTPLQPTVLSLLLPHLASPLFTTDLRHHSSAGAYTFGYIDAARYKAGHDKGEEGEGEEEGVHYTPLVAGAQFWEFAYTGTHVEGQGDWYLANFTAIADTGTTLLLLNKDMTELYYLSVPGAKQNWTVGGIWTFPCQLDHHSENSDSQAWGGEGKGELPDFEVGFENGFVARVPGRFMNYTVMPDDAGRCMGGLQEWDYEFGIFGDVFLKAVYAVFDVGGGRIGFADKELGDGE